MKKISAEKKEFYFYYQGFGQRKKISGIIANDVANTPIEYRKKIRQELYFIQKYGLKDHLNRIGYKETESHYLLSLLGRINYVLSINNSKEFEKYRDIVFSLISNPLE